MTESKEESGQRFFLYLALLFLAIAGFGVADLVLDVSLGQLSGGHAFVETAFILLSLGSAFFLWRGWSKARGSLRQVRRDLVVEQTERNLWHSRARIALEGLGQAIDSQMSHWQLTPAEKETALLLLKGYSHKEIAALTEKSDRTVRQHAVAVYRKSGLSGRAELSAFFLEDLLLPTGDEINPDSDE